MDPTIALEPVRALAMPPHVDSAVELLAAAPVQAIGYGFTSSAYLLGPDGEQEMIARLQGKSNGIPVVAACASVIAGLKALGISRIALVSPPWFDATLAAGGTRHYQAAGFEVVFSSPCDLPSGQKLIEPQTLYDWTRTHVPDTAEAVVIGGNGLRAIGVIDALEQVLGRPVLTANQALFWGLMKAASADVTQVTRYGRLFAA
jgi:maleate isomerase